MEEIEQEQELEMTVETQRDQFLRKRKEREAAGLVDNDAVKVIFKRPGSEEVAGEITEEQWRLAKTVPDEIEGILKRNGFNPDEVMEGWRRGYLDPFLDAALVASLEASKYNVKTVAGNSLVAMADYWRNAAKTVKEWREAKSESLDELVPGFLLKSGLTLVGGAPKSGKTTFARCIAHAVAAGVPFLGRDVVQGDVLYLLLDDDAAWVAKTIAAINGNADARESIYHDALGAAQGAEEGDSVKLRMADRAAALAALDPEGLELPLTITSRHGFHKNLYIESLAMWKVLRPLTKLFVIDTLGKLLPIESGNDYTPVQNALDSIAAWASHAGVSVLFIHHTNKSESDDPVQRLLGSQAIAGAVDIPIVLDKLDGGQGKVSVISRRSGQFELTYKYDLYKHTVSLVTSKAAKAEAAEKRLAWLRELVETLPADGTSTAAADWFAAQGITDKHKRAEVKRGLREAGLASFESSRGRSDQVRRVVGGETCTSL